MKKKRLKEKLAAQDERLESLRSSNDFLGKQVRRCYDWLEELDVDVYVGMTQRSAGLRELKPRIFDPFERYGLKYDLTERVRDVQNRLPL